MLTDHPFKSLSRVVRELGLPVEVASMHSLSKGFLGECGVRGGYAVFENFDPDVLAQVHMDMCTHRHVHGHACTCMGHTRATSIHVRCTRLLTRVPANPLRQAQFVKMKSIELCSNTIGQLSVGLMVRPPSADAKPLYDQEKAEVLAGLRERAAILTETMNSLDGISMPPIGGAMYAFPQVLSEARTGLVGRGACARGRCHPRARQRTARGARRAARTHAHAHARARCTRTRTHAHVARARTHTHTRTRTRTRAHASVVCGR